MVINLFSSPKYFKKFDIVISIGGNCYPGKYIKKYVKSAGSIFDNIGAPLWSIIDVISNNWENMFNRDKYELVELYKPEFRPNSPYIVHNGYNLAFPHDVKTISDITPEFFLKLKGRIQRFEEYCRSANKLLFIRIQRNSNGLIVEYDDSKKSEVELLPLFIELIRSKYGRTQINMIYINTEKDGWNEDKTILFVKIDSLDFRWEDAAETIHKLFVSKNVYSHFNFV